LTILRSYKLTRLRDRGRENRLLLPFCYHSPNIRADLCSQCPPPRPARIVGPGSHNSRVVSQNSNRGWNWHRCISSILRLPRTCTHKSRLFSRPGGRCPLYHRRRTCAMQLGMSAWGHKRTFAPKKIMSTPRKRIFAAQIRSSALGQKTFVTCKCVALITRQ